MTLDQVLNLDNSIQLNEAFNQDLKASFFSISKSSSIIDQTIVFAKNQKFFDEAVEKVKEGSFSSLCIVTHESVSIPANLGKEISILTTNIVEDVMCMASKVFYDQQKSNEQYLADGRQLGTVEIDPTAEISQGVFIGERVTIGENVKILPGCVIMSDVEIANDTILFPRVTVYPKTKIGTGCMIHAGTTIGSDGFGYHFSNGAHQKIWHIGGVIIENNVEIGANTTVDRGTFGDTVIQSGAKIDNLVQIGHNCLIKAGTVICAQSGLGGSATLGEFTVLGGQAGISPSVVVGKQSQVGGKAGVSKSIPEKSVVSGNPARPLREWLRFQATVRKLSERKT